MSADVIVQKYSQALFEAAEESKTTAVVASELEQIVKVFSQEESVSFFDSPFNTVDNKIMVAKSALEGKCSPQTFNFVITVVEKERVAFLSQINQAFQTLVRAQGGETEGTLFVAGEASEGFKAQVEAKLSQSLNKKVKLKVEKDPSLLSGYKVTVGGWTMDDSAQFHLNKIKEDISKRGI
ncbi:ATP synthase F1 subunit delta [bacterium]|nr:ATP synthase F1 subunit delta [bacterium]